MAVARTMSQMQPLRPMQPVRHTSSQPVGRTSSLPVGQPSWMLPKTFAPKARSSQSTVQQAVPKDSMDWLFQAGDLICVKGSADNITSLGSNGGFMGHAMIVTSAPRVIQWGSEEAIEFANLWPKTGQSEAGWLFVVPTMESCRSEEGFYESEYVLYIDEHKRIRLLGEQKPDTINRFEEAEHVLVYQCPLALRKDLKMHLMDDCFESMRNGSQASWSWSTAIRAYLFSADIEASAGILRDAALDEIQKCWSADPICTSLIITFWQRYLCAVADEWNGMRWPHEEIKHAFDTIYRWMPLKADRALPSDMVRALDRCGWTCISRVSAPSFEGRHRSFTV
mmetsp:Transcript_82970/g.130486  ORF Transcript_82970/g.130486 Transcript_82970/m.130486 type:complete len:338 (-) Transcript_82970:46-1059(-)